MLEADEKNPRAAADIVCADCKSIMADSVRRQSGPELTKWPYIENHRLHLPTIVAEHVGEAI